MLLLWRHKLRDCCEKEGDPWKVFLLPPPILRAWVGVLGVTETTVHPLENLQTSQVQHKMQDLFVWSLFLFPRFSEEEPVFSFVLCGRDGGWVCWQIPYIARTIVFHAVIFECAWNPSLLLMWSLNCLFIRIVERNIDTQRIENVMWRLPQSLCRFF